MLEGEWKSASVPNLTTFGIANLPPPSNLYISRDDVILFEAYTGLAGGDTVNLTVRILTPETGSSQGGQPGVVGVANEPGQLLTAINFGLFPVAVPAHTIVSKLVPITEGFLLSAGAIALTASVRGQTFVRAFLIRGGSTSAGATLLLFSDYVFGQFAAGWPFGRILTMREGSGFLARAAAGNPGAGVEWSLNGIAGVAWRIISGQATLVTSATVANRIPQVSFNYSGSGVGLFTGNQVVPASTTCTVTLTLGSPPPVVAGDANVTIPIPPIWLTGSVASALTSSTLNLQAGDVYTNIFFFVEQMCDYDG
jgi:hypothetical protein